MLPLDTAVVQRDGLALVMAALHDDHDAIAQLLATSTPEQLLQLTVFCAQFAAAQCRERQRHQPGLDLPAALRTVALQLAGQDSARPDTTA